MADYLTTDTELTSIADAIRLKGGTSASLVYPTGFISAISAISTGSSITVESLTVTQNGTYSAPTGKAYDPVIVAVQGGALITETTLANGGIVKSISASPVISGTITLSSNGVFDVASYASASIIVPAPAPNLSSLTVTPTESQQAFAPATGFDGFNSVTVNGISSNYVGTAIARKSSVDLTASGSTVTVPIGYYSAQATKNVAAGIEGTPTATKGTVSNNSISVTPAVTNTAGYISGGTKTGTAVTVSASELVSGTSTYTTNGTYDVTNYASVTVNVASSGAKVGTKTVTNSSASNTSISFTSLSGTPKAFVVRCKAQLTRSSNSSYYYVVTIRYNGTDTNGNYWRMSNGTYYNDTTHYSYTYSNETLTVSSSGARNSAGGSFYNGDYELVYVY